MTVNEAVDFPFAKNIHQLMIQLTEKFKSDIRTILDNEDDDNKV
jgi:hypothetical protein